jgi:peptidoglycan/LPS O-acetylase OafA/YrhL
MNAAPIPAATQSPRAAARPEHKQALLKPLHGLRGWFALTVFLYHVWTTSAFLNAATAFAVQGFFCLSGFILAYVYQHNLLQKPRLGDYLDFVRNRFSRVLPLYYVTATVALLMIGTVRMAGYRFNYAWDTSPLVILGNFLAFDVLLYTPGAPGVFYPYDRWSVSIEIWLYILLFPLLAWIYSVIQSQRRLVYAGFVCVLAAAILGPFWYTYENGGHRSNFFGRGVSYFAVGFFIYALRLRTLSHRAHYGLVALFVICGLACSLSLPVTLMPLAAGLLIVLFAYSQPQEPLCRLLSNRVSVFLGDISYSLYLWHSVCLMGLGPVRRKLLSFLSPNYEMLAMALVAVPLTIFLSWLSYKYIEVPARQWLRRSRARPASLLVSSPGPVRMQSASNTPV